MYLNSFLNTLLHTPILINLLLQFLPALARQLFTTPAVTDELASNQ